MSENQVIPEAAVDAAARSLFENHPISKGHQPWSAEWGDGRIKDQFRADARSALEAAAPHMARTIPAQELDALRDGSLVCTAGGIVFQKYDGYFKEGEHGWQRPGRDWTHHTRELMGAAHQPIILIPWVPSE